MDGDDDFPLVNIYLISLNLITFREDNFSGQKTEQGSQEGWPDRVFEGHQGVPLHHQHHHHLVIS